ncbi:DUF397 domain-containing protein [Embleya hyalina]|uniref:Toxin n=1 Tax=Embleya hyalina TaxID=516124 RepID=A0A401YZN8_9ACTN|nr:DUF397 domain-containing protein [Embleya hyalina]GCE00103.1 toxin [Embleya hyalina]
MATSEWFKSSYSIPDNDCLEGARILDDAISIRDSKAPAHGTFLFREATWTPFLTALKNKRSAT